MSDQSPQESSEASNEAYQPIACSLHDRLEDLATTRKTVVLVYEEPGGPVVTRTDTIVDWFVRENAEYLETMSGLEIRLDHLITVAGMSFK